MVLSLGTIDVTYYRRGCTEQIVPAFGDSAIGENDLAPFVLVAAVDTGLVPGFTFALVSNVQTTSSISWRSSMRNRKSPRRLLEGPTADVSVDGSEEDGRNTGRQDVESEPNPDLRDPTGTPGNVCLPYTHE